MTRVTIVIALLLVTLQLGDIARQCDSAECVRRIGPLLRTVGHPVSVAPHR